VLSDEAIIGTIDPGTTTSGVVKVVARDYQNPIRFTDHEMDNERLLYLISTGFFEDCALLAVESILYSIAPMDHFLMRTVILQGRIVQAYLGAGGKTNTCIPLLRRTVTAHLCPMLKNPDDGKVNAALRIRYNEPVHPKKAQGPLRDVRSHAMQALACGVAASDGVRSYIGGKQVSFENDWDIPDDRDLKHKTMFG